MLDSIELIELEYTEIETDMDDQAGPSKRALSPEATNSGLTRNQKRNAKRKACTKRFVDSLPEGAPNPIEERNKEKQIAKMNRKAVRAWNGHIDDHKEKAVLHTQGRVEEAEEARERELSKRKLLLFVK